MHTVCIVGMRTKRTVHVKLMVMASISGRFGCFCPLAIENIGPVHVGVQISVGDSASVLLERYPEVELLEHMLILFLI